MLQTEFEFTLPLGYVDPQGNLHRQGAMRLATAMDEIEPLCDARTRANEAYLSILLLSRVITRLGDINQIDPATVERLFSADIAYLQDLYIRVNDSGTSLVETRCPTCGMHFALDLAGESSNE
jgi:hypothetical protein